MYNSLQKPDGSRVSAVINDRAEFATGLLIGKDLEYIHTKEIPDRIEDLGCEPQCWVCRAGSAEEQSSTQLRKEQYKQELLKQMEEEQRNRMRLGFIYQQLKDQETEGQK